ncbi:hypothetical protein H0H93_008838 [Arthromyces matolae]|nr:hypothetical protein H0H93_008838 [Arthromyces matolae]
MIHSHRWFSLVALAHEELLDLEFGKGGSRDMADVVKVLIWHWQESRAMEKLEQYVVSDDNVSRLLGTISPLQSHFEPSDSSSCTAKDPGENHIA